jgi:hypothetical protein
MSTGSRGKTVILAACVAPSGAMGLWAGAVLQESERDHGIYQSIAQAYALIRGVAPITMDDLRKAPTDSPSVISTDAEIQWARAAGAIVAAAPALKAAGALGGDVDQVVQEFLFTSYLIPVVGEPVMKNGRMDSHLKSDFLLAKRSVALVARTLPELPHLNEGEGIPQLVTAFRKLAKDSSSVLPKGWGGLPPAS